MARHFEKLEDRWLLSAVGFNALSDVTLNAGTTMYIPLNSTDSGQTVNYAVTASDYSKLTPTIMPTTNKTLAVQRPCQRRRRDDGLPVVRQSGADYDRRRSSQLVNSGFYNGLQIYSQRNGSAAAIPSCIQGGNDPPTGPIKTDQPSMAEEFNPDLQFTSAGMLAMARSGPQHQLRRSSSSPRKRPGSSTTTTRSLVFRPRGRA